MQQFQSNAADTIVDGIESGFGGNFGGKGGYGDDFGPANFGSATEAVGTVITTALDMGAIELPPGFNKQKWPFEEEKKEGRDDKKATREETKEQSLLTSMPLQDALANLMQIEVENALLNKSKSVGDIMLEIINNGPQTGKGSNQKPCTTMECLLIAATDAAREFNKQEMEKKRE